MKKKRIIICLAVLLAAALAGGFGFYYMTQPNLRFTDTRTSPNDKGPQYVKFVVDGNQTLDMASDSKAGENISSENIDRKATLEEATVQVDEMLQNELESGLHSFEEPLVVRDPYQNSPLTAVAVYSQEEGASVRVTVKGKEKENDIVDVVDSPNGHIIPIVGLYPAQENEVTLEELDSDGKTVRSNTLHVQTEALPDTLKDVVSLEEKTTASAMGLMVVAGGGAPYLYGFDSDGDIRWYLLNKPGATFGGYPLSNGHFLIESENTLMPTAGKPRASQFHEIDLIGRVYQDYFFESGSHHEVKEKTPDGNLLVLSDSGEGYVQDLLQEYDRKTGKLVKELDLKDLFWDSGYVNKSDWAHTNTFSYDAATDSVIVNPRNLHSGVKINWSTDEIEWILGNPEFWKKSGLQDKVLQPEGDIQWHYQPHTLYQISEDIDNNPDTIHIMVFDNHNHSNRRVEYFDDTGFSYVKLYTVDPAKMTVKQEHVYQCEYSAVTSNYILDYAKKRVFAVCAYAGDEESGLFGRIQEFDYDTEEMLNQYDISHTFYRAYSIQVDLDSCLEQVDTDKAYLKGVVRKPVEVSGKANKPFRTLKANSNVHMSMSLLKDILLLTAKNHSYTQVIFAGGDHTYVYDISDIKMRSKISFVYAVPIPLSEMKADTYQIYMMCQDEYFSLDRSITIL